MFESVATSSLDVALLKWSVKDYFFQVMQTSMHEWIEAQSRILLPR